MNLSGRIAVVGAAGTEVGVVPSMSPTELCVDAALSALRDAGLDKSAIDGLVTCKAFAEPNLYHAEAIWQLRRQAGERQVEGANLGLVHAQGGIMSSHATAIFGREGTR